MNYLTAINDLHATVVGLFWLFCVIVSCFIGYIKNRSSFGLYLGLVLGPISCIAMPFVRAREGEPQGFLHAIGALIAAAMTWGILTGAVMTIMWSDQQKERLAEEQTRAQKDEDERLQKARLAEAAAPAATPAPLTATELATIRARADAHRVEDLRRRAAAEAAEIARKYGAAQPR